MSAIVIWISFSRHRISRLIWGGQEKWMKCSPLVQQRLFQSRAFSLFEGRAAKNHQEEFHAWCAWKGFQLGRSSPRSRPAHSHGLVGDSCCWPTQWVSHLQFRAGRWIVKGWETDRTFILEHQISRGVQMWCKRKKSGIEERTSVLTFVKEYRGWGFSSAT